MKINEKPEITRLEGIITKNCSGHESWQTDRGQCKHSIKYNKIECPLMTERYKCTYDRLHNNIQRVKLHFRY